MKKPILIVTAFIALAFASCQKPENKNNFSCSCYFDLITGTNSRDTTEVTVYPAGTSSTDARADCTRRSDSLISTGAAPSGSTNPCNLIAN